MFFAQRNTTINSAQQKQGTAREKRRLYVFTACCTTNAENPPVVPNTFASYDLSDHENNKGGGKYQKKHFGMLACSRVLALGNTYCSCSARLRRHTLIGTHSCCSSAWRADWSQAVLAGCACSETYVCSYQSSGLSLHRKNEKTTRIR